jgi:hypothetical protein
MLWNQEVHTDREVMANRPDIIIKNRKLKMCVLLDVAIPADRNVMQKEAEKKLKYSFKVKFKSLCIEMQRMWNMKCMIISVVTGAAGIRAKCFEKVWKPYQENIRWIRYKRQLYLAHHT